MLYISIVCDSLQHHLEKAKITAPITEYSAVFTATSMWTIMVTATASSVITAAITQINITVHRRITIDAQKTNVAVMTTIVMAVVKVIIIAAGTIETSKPFYCRVYDNTTEVIECSLNKAH